MIKVYFLAIFKELQFSIQGTDLFFIVLRTGAMIQRKSLDSETIRYKAVTLMVCQALAVCTESHKPYVFCLQAA